MTDRCQLNLRLDGRRDLLEAIKEVASAQGLSVNAWVVRTLEQATANPTPQSEAPRQTPTANTEPSLDIKLDSLLDTRLDNLLEEKLDTLLSSKLTARLAGIDERLGKLKA